MKSSNWGIKGLELYKNNSAHEIKIIRGVPVCFHSKILTSVLEFQYKLTYSFMLLQAILKSSSASFGGSYFFVYQAVDYHDQVICFTRLICLFLISSWIEFEKEVWNYRHYSRFSGR